jgi:hypothetical protein
MKHTMQKVTYTCEQATTLIVQKADGKLSLGQRLRLWLHLQMCSACSRFNIQNQWLDKQLHKLAHGHGHAHHLAEEKKTLLKQQLKDLSKN